MVELNNANLAGTYELTFREGSSSTTVELNGNTVVLESETFTTDTFGTARYTYNEDGTYEYTGSYRTNSVITVTGETPVQDFEIINLDDQGSYSLNNTDRTIVLNSNNTQDVSFFDGNSLTIIIEKIDIDNSFTETKSTEIRLVKVVE